MGYSSKLVLLTFLKAVAKLPLKSNLREGRFAWVHIWEQSLLAVKPREEVVEAAIMSHPQGSRER